MGKHRHRAKEVIKTTTFQGPVAYPPTGRPERRAHGNLTETVRCSCGATQRRNKNLGFVEYGPWREPDDAQ